MRPAWTLLFMLAVLAVVAMIGELMPREGIPVGNAFTLRFPTVKQVLFPEKQELTDISFILEVPTDSVEVDTVAETLPALELDGKPVTIDAGRLAPLADRIRLHYPNDDRSVLHPFFAALESAPGTPHPVRILHYGDSQIEGDRITAYLRNKLQGLFGGTGPGLVSVVEISPHFSVEHEASENWDRYSVMERNGPARKKARFGTMGAMARFTPVLPDTVAPDTVQHTAWITLRPQRASYARTRTWQRCRLWLGDHRTPLTLTVEADGVQVGTEVIEPTTQVLERQWSFATPPGEVKITFSGQDSPNVYGISLESRNGVVMDNLAMRGASGLELRATDQGILRTMTASLDPGLVILQYGGNVLPYMKSVEQAQDYGRAIGADINRIKRMIPGAAVLVIGPSDMSIKEGDLYVTRPFLEDVRDAMKASTLAAGGVFWDMYDAMGGRNSMVSWVEADPPLAAEDYTHFSPLGARKIAELFHEALLTDIALYQKSRP